MVLATKNTFCEVVISVSAVHFTNMYKCLQSGVQEP